MPPGIGYENMPETQPMMQEPVDPEAPLDARGEVNQDRIASEIEAFDDAAARNSEEIRRMHESLEETRKKLFTKLFALMRAMGIDPTDPESVRQFTDYLEQTDPDLAQLLRMSMNQMMPDDREERIMSGLSGQHDFTGDFGRLRETMEQPEPTEPGPYEETPLPEPPQEVFEEPGL